MVPSLHSVTRGDVIERVALRDVPAGLADDQHQLALIIELRRGARAHQRRVVADKGARRAHEHARIFRRVLAVLVFGVAVRVVDADADDLFRRRDRRLPGDRVERMVRLSAARLPRRVSSARRRRWLRAASDSPFRNARRDRRCRQSVTAPYFCAPSTVKVARRGGAIFYPSIRNRDIGDESGSRTAWPVNGEPCSNQERGAGAPHSVCRRGSFSDQRSGSWS